MQKTFIKIGLSIFSIVFFDQVLKFIAKKYFLQPIILNTFIALRYQENSGMAFGIVFPQPWLLFLNVIMLVFIGFFGFRSLNLAKKEAWLIFSFVLGGGLGNLLDRLFKGYVVDYLSIGWWPTFNLADAFLSLGIFLIVVFYDKIKRSNS